MPASALAQRWAAVLIESAYSPMSRRKLTQHLDEHAARLRAGQDAPAVGEWLVHKRFTGPDSLRCTLEVLAPEFPPEVLGALASGYVRATRDQLFAEQEKVKNSLLKAVEDAQRDLHDSEARFAQVFASTAVGIAIFDLSGAVVEANEALAAILGYEEMPKELFAEADAVALAAACERMISSSVDTDRREWELTRRNGDSVWANVVLSVLRGSDGLPKFHVALIEDVSEQRMLQEWLRHQSLTDLLTGLPNRSSFTDKLESALASGEPCTLGYLDVDSLAIVNDGLGYVAGDAVLVEVARRLRAVLPDAVVARVGGDEFVVLIHGSPDVAALAAMIDEELSEPVYLEGAGVAVSTSIGFVHAAGPGADPTAVLRRAHSTLRRAETGGKRQWAIYDHEADVADRARYARIAAMPGAFENGEISVEYAPVSWVSGSHAFVEATLRWGDSRHDDVVAYADALGLASRLMQMVLHDACSRGEPALIRLSRDQSRDQDLAAHVRTGLRDCAFPASSLFLALDVRSMPEGEENLEVLHDMGVHVLLHEFGGGSAGLSTVDRSPVWGVRLARPPSERLARQGMALMVPLLRSAGVHVIGGPGDPDELEALGVDLVVGLPR
ncbi:PAS domain S-box-containing protein/diguanylate cyclase (GGDEF)-like protein [Lentzea atacamensis]|uniref:PAS domain S-box-containing protein/diguanylate cyclase (GGDEF)-like protein n=1 Tax=Lentzea atacamensis TaxID=531938 RepID=A0A316HZ73_9PSEU|nr:diguanylate cyclase [Lentzea atacamensis]PWK86006.1 PAS domain S-box-containing protein/diguanylate cyclase (GGDEF)-like protein [Lentzea atacamensis]